MSQWKNVSIALQGLPQRNLHQFILWKMASSRMLVLQIREWLQIWRKALLCASPGWKKTAKKKVLKEWWQKCSGYVEDCTTIGLRISRYEAAEVYNDFAEELKHTETNPRCVKFTKAVVRHADIRDQNPSLGMICPGEPHQRNPNAPKFEDRCQEETEWQEQGAREAAWWVATSIIIEVEKKQSSILLTLSENRCLLASNLKPEEREFVVDSGTSMLMISKKELNSAEMDTLTKSCSPTTVITANGEVQTHEEATVYVKELDIFLTMKVLQDTPTVLSLGKLCNENGYSYEWINGQKPCVIKKRTVFGYNVIRKTTNRS